MRVLRESLGEILATDDDDDDCYSWGKLELTCAVLGVSGKANVSLVV